MNNNFVLKVKRLKPRAKNPGKSFCGDMGFDLYADGYYEVPMYGNVKVGTSIAVELPPGCGAIIMDRSSLGLKGLNIHGGVIDNGYRGEIFVNLWNHTQQMIAVDCGDRIGQLILIPIVSAPVEVVGELSDTERGEKGYGSSGR